MINECKTEVRKHNVNLNETQRKIDAERKTEGFEMPETTGECRRGKQRVNKLMES